VSRRGGFLGPVRVVASIAILIATGAGCGSQEYLIRSDHFIVTVPRSWEVVRAAGPADGPAIVRVPAPRDPSRGSGVPLDLYFFPWLERRPIAQPTQEAFQRLVADNELNLKAAGPPDRNHCDMLVDHLWLFGARQPVLHVETASGDHIILAAGQASGSLVAVVGVVPASARVCGDVVAMQDAMGALRQALAGADPSDRAVFPAQLFAPYPPNRPSPELQPPPPLAW
jgi:hypothetical protein